MRFMDSALHIKGLLIDMDGLLLDTEQVSKRCWSEAENETGFHMPEDFYYKLIGQSMGRIEERLHEVMDPACDVGMFIEVASRIYVQAMEEDEIPVKPGAFDLLEYLDSRKVPRCLATSTWRDLCRHKLESTGLDKHLPHRVCGDDVKHSKPAPDIYLAAASKLGHPPANLLVLEDSGNGLCAGLEAGCLTAHVPDLDPVGLEIQIQVDRVFRNLSEVKSAFERGEIIVSS